MTSRAAVDDFISQEALAVVGVSRDPKKFGSAVYADLKTKGYRVYPVNPKAESIEGERCYPNLSALPEKVGGVIIVVPPQETIKVVQEAKQAGIRRVWMQQGAELQEAVRFCEENGIQAVAGECIFMFVRPAAFFHRMHAWVWGVMGKAPV